AARGVVVPAGRRAPTKRRPAPAVLLGNERPQQASLCQRVHKFRRIGLLTVELAPVAAGKIGAYAAHQIADLGIAFAQGELNRFFRHGLDYVHRILPALAPACAASFSGAPSPKISSV